MLTTTDRVWDAMVVLSRRAKARRTKVEQTITNRRKRPTTIRSVRAELACDHYAMLADANY